jgi:hypothetical protein
VNWFQKIIRVASFILHLQSKSVQSQMNSSSISSKVLPPHLQLLQRHRRSTAPSLLWLEPVKSSFQRASER